MLVPPAAFADPVSDLVDRVNGTVGSLLNGGSGDAQRPRGGGGGEETGYTPPAHGTNPHGQGTVGVVDLFYPGEDPFSPEDPDLPYPYDPEEGSEELIVGQSRGEQNNGSYHGHVTVLAVLGDEVVGADTDEGDSEGGPTGDLNDELDDICFDSWGMLCLSVMDIDSETDENGSENSFEAVGISANVPQEDDNFRFGGHSGFEASFGRSSGEISEEDGCQTSNGESSIADVETHALEFRGASSESTSTSCNDGTTTQENESSTLLFEHGDFSHESKSLGFSEEDQDDCENGVPNTELIDDYPVYAICGADDSSETGGTQLDEPYGVREGMTLFVDSFCLWCEGSSELGAGRLIIIEPDPLTKTTFAASESQAVAPPLPETPPETPVNPDDEGDLLPEGGKGGEDEPVGPGGPGISRGPSAKAASGLPFTGADVLTLALIGFGVMAAGLAALALVDRRRGLARPR